MYCIPCDVLYPQADENTTTIHDYSVRARYVPPDATADEVQKYFEQWGQVRDEGSGGHSK
jgi:hypothetical protein